MLKELETLIYNYRFENIVISNSLKGKIIFDDLNSNIYYSEDSRSLTYIATGIAAETQKLVVIICNGDNESRSAYSGLTEAYYRKLSILFITIGNQLDYTRELKDCCAASYVGFDNIDLAIKQVLEFSLPVHVSIQSFEEDLTRKKYTVWPNAMNVFKDTIDSACYLFTSQSISNDFSDFKCKIVSNKACPGLEGCLANVLGASLAKKRKRYIGLLTEKEFLHDINTLGNINANDSLFFIVICEDNASFIKTYATSLDYCVVDMNESSLDNKLMKDIIENKKKSVLILKNEDLTGDDI